MCSKHYERLTIDDHTSIDSYIRRRTCPPVAGPTNNDKSTEGDYLSNDIELIAEDVVIV